MPIPKGTNSTHRHALYGLAREYASLAGLPEAQVLAEFERRKLPLRASVELDAKASPALSTLANKRLAREVFLRLTS